MSDTPTAAVPDAAALAARVGAAVWDLEIVEAVDLAPGMRRVRLTAPGLEALGAEPGQDLMLAVPSPTEAPSRRRYSIRRFDAGSASVDLDVVVHGDGPGARWARSVRPGDHVEGIGPRGKVVADPDADWHLFLADESGMAACLAMIEGLAPGAVAAARLEVPGPSHEQVPTVAGGVEVDLRWIHRASGDPGQPAWLVDALDGLALPAGSGHAYLAAELAVVAELSRALQARGMAPEQISAKAYWRLGVANASHGEPPRS